MTTHQLAKVVVGGGEGGGSARGSESARKAQSPRPSPASARDSPRPEQLRRKSTTAAGSGKPWEPGQQDPRPGPASAQLPEPPSALPPLPLPYPQGGGTNLRCRGHSPGRKREPASGGAAGRRAGRAELVGRLRLPGRRQAEHAAAAGLPLPGARGAQTRPRLALDFPGQRSVPPPGRLCDAQPPSSPAGALSLHPCPSGVGAREVGKEVHAVTSWSRAVSPGFPEGIACPGCLDSRAGRRWPRAGTRACEPPGRG